MPRHQPVQPYYRKQINAGSYVNIPYQSRDEKLDPVNLSALRYRVDDLTNAVVVKDWTNVPTPAQKGEVTIPASLNAMNRDYRKRELRQVTFELTDTAGNVSQQLAYYEISAVFQGVA